MALLRVERRRVLLRDKIKEYSTTLILIWTLALAAEAFLTIATVSPHSWDMETNKQLIEGTLWYIRSSFSFMVLFISGLGPGTPHKPYTLLINEDEGEVEQSRPSSSRSSHTVPLHLRLLKNRKLSSNIFKRHKKDLNLQPSDSQPMHYCLYSTENCCLPELVSTKLTMWSASKTLGGLNSQPSERE